MHPSTSTGVLKMLSGSLSVPSLRSLPEPLPHTPGASPRPAKEANVCHVGGLPQLLNNLAVSSACRSQEWNQPPQRSLGAHSGVQPKAGAHSPEVRAGVKPLPHP